nr:nonribosomal peptide synthetase 4635 [Ostreopsis cf. ovata]
MSVLCFGLTPSQYILAYLALFFATVAVYAARCLKEKKKSISGIFKALKAKFSSGSAAPLKQTLLDVESSTANRVPLHLKADVMRRACADAGFEEQSLEAACLAALTLVQCRRHGGAVCLGLQKGSEDVELEKGSFKELVRESRALLQRGGSGDDNAAKVLFLWNGAKAKPACQAAAQWCFREEGAQVVVTGTSFEEERSLELCWQACAEKFGRDVWQVPIVPSSSLEIVKTWGKGPLDFAARRDSEGKLIPVPHLIAANQGKGLAGRAAIAGDGFQLSYEELFSRTAAICEVLNSNVDAAKSRAVILCLSRGEATAPAFLAVLAAGYQAVPVDVHWPEERIQQVAEESGATVALTSGSALHLLQGVKAKAFVVDEALFRQWGGKSRELPVVQISPEQTAVVLFTSGSSGKPKGILLSHTYLTALICGIANLKGMDQASRTLCYHSPTWMPFLDYVLTPLVVGGCCLLFPDNGHVVKPDELVAFAKRHRANQAGFVPAVLDIIAETGIPSTFYDCGVGGAAVPKALCDRVLPMLPARPDGSPATLYTGYSGTEVGDVSVIRMRSLEDVEESASPSGFMVAGKPHTAQTLALLDAGFNPVGPGAIGEITVTGPGMASGYLNLPEKTVETFLPSCAALGGLPAVRSGDLGKWTQGGSLVLVGRRDTMVKVRGARIEIGEVEGTVASHPEVQAVCVTVVEDKLVAYVVPAVPANLRDYCKQRLVAYMVPHIFEGLEALPRLPNGKVNKKLLPAPQERTDGAEAVMELDSLGRMRKFTRRAVSEDKVLDNVRAILIGLVLQAHATPIDPGMATMKSIQETATGVMATGVSLGATWGPVQLFILNISRSGGWSSLAFLSGFDDTRAMEPYSPTYREPLFLAIWLLLGFNWTMWYLPVFVYMRVAFCGMHRLGLQKLHIFLASQVFLLMPAFVDLYVGWHSDPTFAVAECPSQCVCPWQRWPWMQTVAHYTSGWWVAAPAQANSFLSHGLIFIPCYWIGFYGGGRIFKVLTKIADEPSLLRRAATASTAFAVYYALFLVFGEVNALLDDQCTAFWSPDGSFVWKQVAFNLTYYSYNLLTSLLWVVFIASAVPVHMKYMAKVCFASLLASGLMPCVLDTPRQALVLREWMPESISPAVELSWTFFVPFLFELTVGAVITTVLPILIKAGMRACGKL